MLPYAVVLRAMLPTYAMLCYTESCCAAPPHVALHGFGFGFGNCLRLDCMYATGRIPSLPPLAAWPTPLHMHDSRALRGGPHGPRSITVLGTAPKEVLAPNWPALRPAAARAMRAVS